MEPQYPSGGYSPSFIAPNSQPVRKGPNKLLVIGLLVGALIAIGIGFMFVLNSSSDKIDSQKNHLAARMDTLEKLIDAGNTNVKSPTLRKVQADASILVQGANYNIREVLGVKKAPADVVANEADKPTFEDLDDAKVNGNFDRPYQSALSTKLESTMALLKEIYTKTKSAKLKEAASKSYDTYSSILNELSTVQL